MDIRSVNSANQGVYSIKSKTDLEKRYKKDLNNSENITSGKSDKLELSEEAKKILPIKQKISSGEYNKPEVYNFLAEKLNELLSPENL